MSKSVVRFLPFMVATSLVLSGCSGSGSSAGGSAAATGVNIYGKLGGSSSSLSLRKMEKVEALTNVSDCDVKAYDLTGDTVLASAKSQSDGTYTITGGSIEAGKSYKIVSDCSGTKTSAIQNADATEPSAKTPAPVNPTTTLIAAQIVQAIVAAVKSATEGLPESVREAVQQSILTPQVLATIVSTVSSTVQAAIDNGTMAPPTEQSASSMAAAVSSITSSSSDADMAIINNAYSAADGTTSLPPAVTSAVTSVASQASAFPGCDKTLADKNDKYGRPIASYDKCLIAVAKTMNNVVHFDVALRTDGAFASYSVGDAGSPTQGIANCDATDPVLIDAFPNSAFESPGIAGYCIVHHKARGIDRNRVVGEQGGEGGGLVFAEAGTGSSPFVNGGLLSAMAQSLWNGGNGAMAYKLSDIDKIVFTPNSDAGAYKGLGARLIYVKPSFDWTQDPTQAMDGYNPRSVALSLLTVSNGTTALSPEWPSCNSSPCQDPNRGVNFNFQNALWSSASSEQDFASAIGESSWAGSVFLKKFGGAIPDEQTLKKDMVSSTTHLGYNRSGQSRFFVLYKSQPSWGSPACSWGSISSSAEEKPFLVSAALTQGSESVVVAMPSSFEAAESLRKLAVGQTVSASGIPADTFITEVSYDNNGINLKLSNAATANVSAASLTVSASAKCIAFDEVEQKWSVEPAVRVNLILGFAPDINKLRHIEKITVPTTGSGQYYIMPVMNGRFGGVMQFVDASTGRVLLDDELKPRFVMMVTDANSQCGQNGLPAHDSMSPGNCDNGQMFNVQLEWSCSDSAPCQEVVSAFSKNVTEAAINRGAALPPGQKKFDLNLQYQTVQAWNGNGPGVVAATYNPAGNMANNWNSIPLKFTVDGNGDIVSASLFDVQNSLGNNEYVAQQHWNCSAPGMPCEPQGYVLLDKDGAPRVAYTGSSVNVTKNNNFCSLNGCANNAVVFAEDYFLSDLSGLSFPYADGDSSHGNFRQVAQMPQVFMGPAVNPNWDCALDPFFLDLDGNGKVTTKTENGKLVCSEPTFSDEWMAGQFMHPSDSQASSVEDLNKGPTPISSEVAMAKLIPNPSNGYVYGDEQAASALLHLAFGPMLDGKHTLDDKTTLNAFQAFGLIYMFFTAGGNEGGTHIEGIYNGSKSTNMFNVTMPACNGDPMICNAAFSGGFLEFHQ